MQRVSFAFFACVVGASAFGCSPNSSIGLGGNGGESAATGVGTGDTSGTMATGSATASTGTGGCTGDAACAPGTICDAGTCVPGCNPGHGCDAGNTCCAGSCFNLDMDLEHCGMCDNPCPTPANIDVMCDGTCTFGACDSGYNDCDGVKTNGCEVQGSCNCTPGDTQVCYDGIAGTETHAPCHTGLRTCNAAGTAWGACQNETIPQPEICANGVDEDCNGTADDVPDLDGDGWTVCQGDCCDEPGGTCSNPELVNPGAFEAAGNTVDDDCDGNIDNVLGPCDAGLLSNSASALDYAKAINLCKNTTEPPPNPQSNNWGVISASFALADGSGTPAVASRSIRTGFGSGVTPLAGSSLAVLSTGAAAAQTAPNNVNPGYAAFQGGQNMATSSGVPGDWLTANGGNFPNAPGCPNPAGGTTAHDPVMLKVRVRVPTNANSFAVSTFFYSSEYPEWVCSPYNDFFLTLLDSSFAGVPANPADKNLAFYDPPPAGAPFYPVGVNLAFGNTGLFSQCKNGPTGCGGGSVTGNTSTCVGTTQLTGTGFDVVNPPPQFVNDPGWCGTSNFSGGGTSWLTTSGNVTPGETIDLRFVIWDTGDTWYDSLVLLDNFVWSVSPSTPGTHN